MKIKILVSDAHDFNDLPKDYLKYDVVVMANDKVLHSRKSTKYIANVIENTKLYCHKCFQVFQSEEELKNHKCGDSR
ncbi:hypothetical protein AZ270_gp11 [Acidianus tailed spindle virus]|uniref:hypothetical protein n=1 Tax=Acidianus tailed spindle virus TaxID=1797140 RepID=UPI00076F2DCA|nr:hypothetical protein AZ270_gp11 [Acidianus tailed spindle virus]AME30034.1 hypothetical protein ATSV_A76 [Acidianus tailed spindle virus]